MFGLFRKQRPPKPPAEKVAAVAAAIASSIQIQLSCSTLTIRDFYQTNDKTALGYVFGFHDGFLQAVTLPGGEDAQYAALAGSYRLLAESGVLGTEIAKHSMTLQGDDIFEAARREGGTEAVAFLTERKTPAGLMAIAASHGRAAARTAQG